MILCRLMISMMSGFITLMIFMSTVAAQSQAEITEAEIYTIINIPVDVTAETAAKAREQAIVQGETKAFQRLLERLTLLVDHEKLPQYTLDDMRSFVQRFSLADEKTSSVRYIANMTVQFKAQKIRKLLLEYNIPFSETQSKPVIVLPVYRKNKALLLWEDSNVWRKAWYMLPESDGLVPLIHPLGDLTDISVIGPTQAINGDLDSLTAIARHYGRGDVLVVDATEKKNFRTGTFSLEAVATRYSSVTGSEHTFALQFESHPKEMREIFFLRAAKNLAVELEDSWKRNNLLQVNAIGVVAVSVLITGLQDWLDIQRRLEHISILKKIDLILLAQDEVRVNLYYLGSSDQLVTALAQADLALTPSNSGWILKRGQATRKGLP